MDRQGRFFIIFEARVEGSNPSELLDNSQKNVSLAPRGVEGMQRFVCFAARELANG